MTTTTTKNEQIIGIGIQEMTTTTKYEQIIGIGIYEMTTTTTKLTTDNKQKATSKTACNARGQKW